MISYTNNVSIIHNHNHNHLLSIEHHNQHQKEDKELVCIKKISIPHGLGNLRITNRSKKTSKLCKRIIKMNYSSSDLSCETSA